ncbi:hypothetical protein, partial [Enterobacter cloacae]|uniref:hypothetical protein n=1 Tax=Enterobacter cloacae TaxID=550 RepID=UPI0013D28406
GLQAAEEVAPEQATDWRNFLQSRWGLAALTGAVVVLVFAVGAALLMRLPVQQAETTAALRDAPRQATAAMLQPGNGMPSIY